MTHLKFTGEKLINSFLARVKEYYPKDEALKINKYTVIFKDVSVTPTKQNNLEKWITQYNVVESQPTKEEIANYEEKLADIKSELEMQKLHDEQVNINFRKEFKALLEKYNASIDFSCSGCSDTHGIYDEKMIVCFNHENRNVGLTCVMVGALVNMIFK